MKKGGGIGPAKPWQPLQCNAEKGAKSEPVRVKISLLEILQLQSLKLKLNEGYKIHT